MKPLKFYMLNVYLESLPMSEQKKFLETLPPILKSRMFGEDEGYEQCIGCERIDEIITEECFVCEVCDYEIGFKCEDCFMDQCYCDTCDRHICFNCLETCCN